MRSDYIKKALRFCCSIDDLEAGLSLTLQTEMALKAGATMIRYEGGHFSPENWTELQSLCSRCQSNEVLFVVKNNFLLTRALGASGVHLEYCDAPLETIRSILGPEAIIGIALSTRYDESIACAPGPDYFEDTPFHPDSGCLPATAGGILNGEAAAEALRLGASGISSGSRVFKSDNPATVLASIAEAAGLASRPEPEFPWRDEFGLIEKILKEAPETHSGLIVVPGDDACLLSALSRPVISTDTQKEGVHFRLDWQSPEEIGEKAVIVTLSDLAASYAEPVSLFVNLGIPPRVSDAFVEEIYRGIRVALERYDCSLGGGNISAGEELSLDFFAIGQGREDIFPKRSEAKVGFGLFTTGPLGMARAGLEALRKNDPGFPDLVDRFKHPRARFDAAKILADHGITCVMDISDGLSGDAAHIAEASHVTIELDVSALSHPDSLVAFCRKYDQTPQALSLAGGEDYELLFACPQEVFSVIKASLPGAEPVGSCRPFEGRHVICPEISLSSYRHGA